MTPIQKDDLFKLEFLQDAAVSSAANLVAYVVAQYDADDDKDLTTLYLTDLGNNTTKAMTPGEETLGGLAFSPDGRSIGFMSDRGGKPQIYALPVDGGEARQLTHIEQGVRSGPLWSPDGRLIAFTVGLGDDDMPKLDEPYRVTRNVYRFDNIGIVDAAINSLHVLNIETGETQELVQAENVIAVADWSPDGKRLLYTEMFLPDSFAVANQNLRIVDLDGNITRLLPEWGLVGTADWLADGDHIAFVGTAHGKPIGSKADVYVLSLADGSISPRTDGLRYGVGGSLQPDYPAFGVARSAGFFVQGDDAYTRVQIGGDVNVYRVALTGDAAYEPVLTGERACLPLALDDNLLVYAVSQLTDPLELYVCDPAKQAEQQLTHLNRALLAERTLSDVQHLTWPSIDGVQVEGWFLSPKDASGPLPTILYIHGGPHSAFGNMFSFDFQMLVGAGYGVLIINQRASTGYGDEFSTAIKGDWGNLDYHDLMTGVDFAIAQGLADGDKLGVCGLSGGGNLSCWIVGQTERFKAAVPENPVTNWVSFYGVSDIGVYFAVEELGGPPHEIPEVYMRCAPITYAHRCSTPTLLVQGENDYRCPTEQSEQFYTVLKANGCIAEMLRLPASSHAGSIGGRPSLRRAQNDALLDWFDRYVLQHEAVEAATTA
jgi:dipeptidyl aminopeptidase/acylaminoacyl peptidase